MPSVATIRQPTYWNLNPFLRAEYGAITCPKCQGTGRYNHKDCYKCARYGVVFIKKEEQ